VRAALSVDNTARRTWAKKEEQREQDERGVAGEATTAEMLRCAVGCVSAGDYLQLGSLFFAVSAVGAIDRLVLAGRLEDIPPVGSDQWRDLGYTSADGMFAARHCHCLKKPAPSQQPPGFWSQFAALFNDPELRPLAERWDCRAGLRFLRAEDDAGEDGRLIFEYDGVESV